MEELIKTIHLLGPEKEAIFMVRTRNPGGPVISQVEANISTADKAQNDIFNSTHMMPGGSNLNQAKFNPP